MKKLILIFVFLMIIIISCVPPKSLVLITPNGGDIFIAGTVQTIVWESVSIGSVNIELWREGLKVLDIVTNEPSDGTYYKIKIIDVEDSEIFAISETNFTIPLERLHLTYPNGGEIFELSTTETIEWESGGNISKVKIDLIKNNTIIKSIVSGLNNLGTYNWNINDTSMVLSNDYSIKVTSMDNSTITDTSNSNFSILKQNINVSAPTTGTEWANGSSNNTIQWSVNGGTTVENVDISLWEDKVKVFDIVLNQTNTGTYNWSIPSNLTSSANYRIIVLDSSNPLTVGKSNHFLIYNPDIVGMWTEKPTNDSQIEFQEDTAIFYEYNDVTTTYDPSTEIVYSYSSTENLITGYATKINPSVFGGDTNALVDLPYNGTVYVTIPEISSSPIPLNVTINSIEMEINFVMNTSIPQQALVGAFLGGNTNTLIGNWEQSMSMTGDMYATYLLFTITLPPSTNKGSKYNITATTITYTYYEYDYEIVGFTVNGKWIEHIETANWGSLDTANHTFVVSNAGASNEKLINGEYKYKVIGAGINISAPTTTTPAEDPAYYEKQ